MVPTVGLVQRGRVVQRACHGDTTDWSEPCPGRFTASERLRLRAGTNTRSPPSNTHDFELLQHIHQRLARLVIIEEHVVKVPVEIEQNPCTRSVSAVRHHVADADAPPSTNLRCHVLRPAFSLPATTWCTCNNPSAQASECVPDPSLPVTARPCLSSYQCTAPRSRSGDFNFAWGFVVTEGKFAL